MATGEPVPAVVSPIMAELRYAAPVLERYLKQTAKDDRYHLRRRAVAERALARC